MNVSKQRYNFNQASCLELLPMAVLYMFTTIVEIITSANESNNIPEVTPLVQAKTDESGAIVW